MCLLAASAAAMHYEGGGTTIDLVPNSGCSTDLTDGNTHVQDIKGYPFGSPFTDGSTIIETGLGVLVGTGEAGPVVPYGTVQLHIERDGNNVRLTWDYTGEIDLYVLTGDGSGSYSNDTGWTILSTEDGDGEYIDPDQVGEVSANAERYYKGIYAGFSSDTYIPQAWPVGKIDVPVASGGGMQLVGLPLDAGTATTSFYGQLSSEQEIVLLPQAGSGLDYVTVYNDSITGVDYYVNPTTGFWLRNPNSDNVVITFVGPLPPETFTADLLNFDLTANPIAKAISTDNLGVDGDVVLPQSGSGLDYYVKDGGSWGPSFPTLNMNAGFWYKYSVNNRRWNVDPTIPDATIEQY